MLKGKFYQVIDELQIGIVISESAHEIDRLGAADGHTTHRDVFGLHRFVDHRKVVFDRHDSLLGRPEAGGLDRLSQNQRHLLLQLQIGETVLIGVECALAQFGQSVGHLSQRNYRRQSLQVKFAGQHQPFHQRGRRSAVRPGTGEVRLGQSEIAQSLDPKIEMFRRYVAQQSIQH